MAAQRGIAVRGPQLENLRRFSAFDHFSRQTAKSGERKRVGVRPGTSEADIDFACGPAREFERRQQAVPVQFGGRGSLGMLGNETTAAYLAFQKAGFFEHGVGGGNGGAIQAELASQFSSGWQPFARLDGATGNQRSNC